MLRYTNLRPFDGQGEAQARQGRSEMYRLLMGLNPALREQQGKAGDIIAHQGDTSSFFMLVLEGWIALFKSLDDGETQIVDLLIDGDFALVTSSAAEIIPYSVEALEDVRYLAFSKDMVNGPEPEAAILRSHLAATITVTQSRTAELLLRVGHASAETRICFALLELYLRLEEIGKVEGASFHIPMTQKHLGQFTGLSNVHVSRTLRRLARNGLLRTSARTNIEIRDIEAVCRIAELDMEELRAEIIPKT